jgi:WhiB family transcriptional regulator, redox-sensing transcriptional regulator
MSPAGPRRRSRREHGTVVGDAIPAGDGVWTPGVRGPSAGGPAVSASDEVARTHPAAQATDGGIAAVSVKGASGVAGRPDCVLPWTGTQGGDAGGPRRQVAAARRPDEHESDSVGAPAQRRRRAVETQAAEAVDRRSDWRTEALCAQTDHEAFFPEVGRSAREARGVCARCPVTAECLEWAVEHDERFGIWGGATARERVKLRRLGAIRVERGPR